MFLNDILNDLANYVSICIINYFFKLGFKKFKEIQIKINN